MQAPRAAWVMSRKSACRPPTAPRTAAAPTSWTRPAKKAWSASPPIWPATTRAAWPTAREWVRMLSIHCWYWGLRKTRISMAASRVTSWSFRDPSRTTASRKVGTWAAPYNGERAICSTRAANNGSSAKTAAALAGSTSVRRVSSNNRRAAVGARGG